MLITLTLKGGCKVTLDTASIRIVYETKDKQNRPSGALVITDQDGHDLDVKESHDTITDWWQSDMEIELEPVSVVG